MTPKPWTCLQIRVTTFYSALRSDLSIPGISAAFGIEPDAIEMKPQELRRFEMAALGPGVLTYSSTANRVDWLWKESDIEDGHQDLGVPDEALKAFLTPLVKWASSQENIVRVAVGGIFGKRVQDREEGYRLLDDLIDEIKLDPKNTSEFLYQINHVSTELIGEETILYNNIEKWTCRQFQQGFLTFSIGSPIPAQTAADTLATYASCELDINTAADNIVPILPQRVPLYLQRGGELLIKFLNEKDN